MKPMEVLVTSLAFLMGSDGDLAAEEKAKLLGLLNKHVNRGEMTQAELQTVVRDAFNVSRAMQLETFLFGSVAKLSRGQKLAIFANLYDIALADGEMRAGEAETLETFRRALEIGNSDMRAIKELMLLKNDTRMFTEPNHPCNAADFMLKVAYTF